MVPSRMPVAAAGRFKSVFLTAFFFDASALDPADPFISSAFFWDPADPALKLPQIPSDMPLLSSSALPLTPDSSLQVASWQLQEIPAHHGLALQHAAVQAPVPRSTVPPSLTQMQLVHPPAPTVAAAQVAAAQRQSCWVALQPVEVRPLQCLHGKRR
jgi:hypothetical protein